MNTPATDIKFHPATTTQTHITVEPVTEQGKSIFQDAFGVGAVSARIEKVQLPNFMAWAAQRGGMVGM